MFNPILGIDHTYVLVNDLDASAERYRRLGFTLSPRGLHSAEKGTANHTIVFGRDYLELLGILNPTAQNEPQRDHLLTFGEGLHAVANRTRNADAAKGELARLGIASDEVAAFSRPLSIAGGGERRASFRTLSLHPASVPFGHFFLCQHETPELVWQRDLQVHPNGALRLGGIVGVSEEPAALAQAYVRLYADGSIEATGREIGVRTGENSAPFVFLDPTAAAERYPGLALKAVPSGAYAALIVVVADRKPLRAILQENGVPFDVTGDGRTLVAATEADGVVLDFREA